MRAPALAATPGEPSLLPLSATITSPAIPPVASAATASCTQPPTEAASLRQGITIDTSGGAIVRSELNDSEMGEYAFSGRKVEERSEDRSTYSKAVSLRAAQGLA